MQKRLLILFLFSLFSFEFAKSNPIIDYPYKTSKHLTITNCSWEKAEFYDNSMEPYVRSYLYRRYCVDKTNKTIFSYSKDRETNEIISIKRELGFLNKNEFSGYSISPEVQWKIDSNNKDVIRFSKNDMDRMSAKKGDLVYIQDSRWWYGGLKSIHSVSIIVLQHV